MQILPAWRARGLVHGDLKLDNVGVNDYSGSVHVIDLESVQRLEGDGGGTGLTVCDRNFVWTEGYEAPEVHREPACVSATSDVYSVGRMLAMVLVSV